MTVEELIQILAEDVVEGSKALLGATLVRGNMRGRIVETEAYRHDDPACHAFGKRAMKNMALWGQPGNSYVYFTYGNHWMLNVVAHREGEAAAVLIRAAEPLEGISDMQINRGLEDVRNLLSGPGKLARSFNVTSKDNDLPLFDCASPLFIEPALRPLDNIIEGPRIGIAEGKWHEVPWRFVDGERLQWVSKPLPPATRPGKSRNTFRKV
jgi:DNA-3-methyladenine glycosylase